MTDRMEPTMQLRWIKRRILDYEDNKVRVWKDSDPVLQQLWSKYHPAYRGPMADGYFEWRDIPEVEEG